MGLITDYFGAPISGPPDIGAIEFPTGSSYPAPLCTGSVIKNETPSLLEVTYNKILDNVIPSASSFIVHVNSDTRLVNSIKITGNKVLLYLFSPVFYGDIITVTYSKPWINPIRSLSGQLAGSITNKIVTNQSTLPDKDN